MLLNKTSFFSIYLDVSLFHGLLPLALLYTFFIHTLAFSFVFYIPSMTNFGIHIKLYVIIVEDTVELQSKSPKVRRHALLGKLGKSKTLLGFQILQI